MNFAFSEEQEELRKMVRSFLENKSAEEAVREQMETVNGYDGAVWGQMGSEMALQGIAIPEEFGGQGYSFIELGVVLEEMGRALLCAPYFSSVVLAANTLLLSSTGNLNVAANLIMSTGGNLSLAAGNAVCWGSNGNGQVGTGSTTGPQGCGPYNWACAKQPVTVVGFP